MRQIELTNEIVNMSTGILKKYKTKLGLHLKELPMQLKQQKVMLHLSKI